MTDEEKYLDALRELESKCADFCKAILVANQRAEDFDPLGEREHVRAGETLRSCHEQIKMVARMAPGAAQMFGGL